MRHILRHIYRIDDGEIHWYSAESKEQALKMHVTQYDDYKTVEAYIEDLGEPDIEMVDDEKMIKVIRDGNVKDFIEKTAREWADVVDGFLASTCW